MQGKSNRRLVLIGGAALLVLLLVVFARIRPLAPGSIDILTGPERSHYHAMGVRMSEELSKHGITARVVVTAGALDNLRQLRGRDDNAIALATSDIEREFDDEEAVRGLVTLGSIAFEPLWLFTKVDSEIEQVSDLAGHEVATGPRGSASRAIGNLLLEANGIADEVTTTPFEALAAEAAATALLSRELDAAFLSGGMKTSPVDRLLSTTGVQPVSFPRAATYAALYPGLAVFEVPPGAVDLAKNLPQKTLHTVAGTTTLVATEDLHGAMVEVLINVARDIQPRQSLESPEGVFPTTQHVSLPLDPRARRFYQDGPSKLSRHLPYWGSALLDQIVFVLIPALAIVFTLLEAVPTLLGLKFSLRAQALTRKLAKVERSLIAGEDTQVLWEALEEVEGQSAELRVPRRKAGEFLELRQNIHDARERIEARDPTQSA